ncbi:MAG: AAA family ATPase, partial [Methanobacteriota archaeon]
MHLKQVELENFKSFGSRKVIPFLEGFTAITGPNGSGKSNIGDAILFVLGPRSSRAIRAGKLTDLIFNGGKQSKKGADHCRVSLTFDNRDRNLPIDADDVTLTRLVKRSQNEQGYNSYFYVNGHASSLTEFDNLLAHARISADGHNFVLQGRVQNIIGMSPVDRRRILDEIAGITRFDEDIDRAEKRRAEVDQNLERIEIILKENAQQLRTLERQKDAAARYKQTVEEVGAARASLGGARRTALDEDLAGTRDALGKAAAGKTEH